jgi:hypothetical protein
VLEVANDNCSGFSSRNTRRPRYPLAAMRLVRSEPSCADACISARPRARGRGFAGLACCSSSGNDAHRSPCHGVLARCRVPRADGIACAGVRSALGVDSGDRSSLATAARPVDLAARARRAEAPRVAPCA